MNKREYIISKEMLGHILGRAVDYPSQVEFNLIVDYETLHENYTQNKDINVDTLLKVIKNKFYDAGYSITIAGTKKVTKGEIHKDGVFISKSEDSTEIKVMINLYEKILKEK